MITMSSPYCDFQIFFRGEWRDIHVYEARRPSGVRLFLFSGDFLDAETVYGPWDQLFSKVFTYSLAVPPFFNALLEKEGKKPEVFHCNDWHSVLCGNLVKRYFRIPVVYTIHRICRQKIEVDALSREGFSDILDNKYIKNDLFDLELFGADYCDALNTVSFSYLNEEWDSFFGNFAGKVTHIWNGIDDSFWNPDFLENPGLPREERRKRLLAQIGMEDGWLNFYVGRLDAEQKGVDHLLEAVGLILGGCEENAGWSGGDLRFVILGSGDPKLAERIAELERQFPSNIKGIIGYVKREVTREYYASADICVIPSNFEPFGLVQLEAMCLGSIPLGTRVGGIKDTVLDLREWGQQGTGYLVPPRNGPALAEGMADLARLLRKNPEFVDKIRRNGRPHVMTNFSWKKTGQRYLALYQDRAPMRIPFTRLRERSSEGP
ncbi:MAG: glycosyltransferase [Armatimonadetes bacterium]|nr:glycosyltransferase [Armatimonadota bacterium]